MAKVVQSAPTLPSAWVVVNNQKNKSHPSDRGRKSIKNGKIYLDDGQEFEIELHNTIQECVLCDIKLNGQSVSKNGLVLRPGERFYLDCFIDDKKKFVFKTYDVENTEESENSISKNGLLEVYFYKEEVININNWRNRFDTIIIEKYYPFNWVSPYRYYNIYGNIYGSGIYGSGGFGSTTGTTINTVCNAETTTSNGSCFNNMTINTSYSSNSLETGRIEKGSSSSQKFNEIDMEFQSHYISHNLLQLLPNSRKPIETSEIKSNFCSECGSKIKDSFKFCPNCGLKTN